MSKKTAMRRLIEQTAGFKVKTPSDFTRLADMIRSRTGSYISETALKRFFGYIEGWQNPRPGVWDTLSRFVGFVNEDSFTRACGLDPEAISGIVTARSLKSADLPEGAELEIRWFPDRSMRVRHLGAGEYLILKALNTALEKSGTFHTDTFIADDSLLLNPYAPPTTAGADYPGPNLYEIGRTGGIEFTLVNESQEP